MKKTSTKNSTVKFRLDPNHPPKQTPAEKRALDAMTDRDIDTSDIPSQTGAARWYSPVARAEENKAQVTLRLDRKVLDFFKDQGPGYQTRINAVLRQYVSAHSTTR